MSKVLPIEKDNALKAWKEADSPGKKMLVNLFGNIFCDNPMEYVQTFKDVCDEAGAEPDNYKILPDQSHAVKSAIYYSRLQLIALVFNQGWVADLADISQNKYYPWFNIIQDKDKPSGFGLSYCGCGCDDSNSGLGARPYFKDRDTAIYVGKQFLAEFEGWAQYTNLAHKQKYS